MTTRTHATGYASIVERADAPNSFDMYIGKAGVNGRPTFTAVLNENTKTFAVTDTRTNESADYLPKLLSVDGKTKTATKVACIAQSLIDQIVKKFIVVKVEKAPKEKVVKEKAPKVVKEKAVKVAKVKKEKVVVKAKVSKVVAEPKAKVAKVKKVKVSKEDEFIARVMGMAAANKAAK